MKQTPNYNFKLPAPSDTLDIEVLDANFESLDALLAALQSGKADKNSPQFTGTPTAPTATSGTNSTQIATTAFVQGLIAVLQSAISNKVDKHSPSLTGTPTAPTATSDTNSTQIATTAFVQMLIKQVDYKLTELTATTLDNTYALLLLDKDSISLCSNMDDYGISYSQYQDGVYDRGILCMENSVKLPKNSHAPVFFKSWADISGDESEIYNVQMLLYLDGTVYARHRYLWTIGTGGNGIIKNPTWSEWSTENPYAYYRPQNYFIRK